MRARDLDKYQPVNPDFSSLAEFQQNSGIVTAVWVFNSTVCNSTDARSEFYSRKGIGLKSGITPAGRTRSKRCHTTKSSIRYTAVKLCGRVRIIAYILSLAMHLRRYVRARGRRKISSPR